MTRAPSINRDKCVGCDACLELCPDVFKWNEAGYIEVADLDVYPRACIEEAINCCPTDCIFWEESEGEDS
jgi:ferredoxin